MRRYLPLCILWLAMISCSGTTFYKDLPVEFDQKSGTQSWGDEEFLHPGVYEEQLFRKLEKDGELHIIQGFQGGAWIHLSVRVSGVPGSGRIKVSLSEGITKIEYDIKLVRSAEGFLEGYDIPVPIEQEGDALEALYGKKVELRVEYSAQKKTLKATIPVVLAKG